MKIFLIRYFMFIGFIFLGSSFHACSPVKGYVGPELPKEQLAVVYYEDCGSEINKIRASVQGVEFGSSGVTLLPGEHNIDVSAELLGRPYDCVPQTVFDDYGYQACLDRRARAIEKNSKSMPNCYVWQYEKTTYWCNQLFKQHLCTSKVNLEKQKEYEYCVYQNAGFVRAKIVFKDSNNIIKDVECLYSSEDVRRLEFNSMY